RLGDRAALALDRRADEHDRAVGPGHGALDQDQAVLGVDVDDLEVLDGHALATHAAGHALAPEGAARGRRHADRAGVPVLLVHTVAVAHAAEVVPLHDAGVALALAGAGHVDGLAPGERVARDRVTDGRELVAVVVAQLGQDLGRFEVGLGQVALGGLADVLARAVGQLDRGVAIGLGRLDLGDGARAGLD